jgi:cell wall-associated NlpC family hydrolase
VTPAEFVARAVGLPWARWRADWQAMDCYGLIVLWHREVLGVDIGDVPQTDIAAGFVASSGWEELPSPAAGATCWMAWRAGAPTHCGVMLDGQRVLHAEGRPDQPGNVRITRLRALGQVYGQIRYYRHLHAPQSTD